MTPTPTPLPCDIAIIGGGPAGVTTAIAARRAGAKRVILIEQSDKLGGAVTHAMHRAICGLYADKPASLTHTLNAGLQREVITRMSEIAPEHVTVKQMGKAHVLEFPTHAWQTTLQTLCDDAGVELHMQTSLVQVNRSANHIDAISLEHHSHPTIKPTRYDLSPRIVIDATGQGHVLQRAGHDTHQPASPDARMMGGYAMRLANLTGDTDTLRLQIPFTLAKAVQQNQLPSMARLTVFHPGPNAGEGVCKMAVSPGDLLEAGLATSRALAAFNCLKNTLDAFAQAHIIEHSPSPQSRDGLRLAGLFTLTQQHVLSPPPCNDPYAIKAWWPIERWDAATGPTYQYGPVGEPYAIPTNALRCATVNNLLAAGMNISADADAAASLRASGVCLALGDAAGRLAQSMLQR